MARVIFVGAYAYAQQVLDAFPEPPVAVVTLRNDKPRQQHLAVPSAADIYINGDVGQAVLDHDPDLVVVAGWRRLIPDWIVTRYPVVGFHSAKLPEYPGRAPVANAILRGDRTLTNTMLYLDERTDGGDVIDETTFAIGKDPDVIYRDIGTTSALMLQTHWLALLEGVAPRRPQDPALRGPLTPADAWGRL